MTRWLDEREATSWLAFARLMMRLPAALDRELQRDHGLTHYDYLALAMLGEAGDGTLTMSSLATQTEASLSRLSHVVAKLEGKGWVERRGPEPGRRATLVSLTSAGRTVLERAAPDHVETVRALVFDALTSEQVDQLGEACQAMHAALAESGLGRR